jgi:hypothetical protein
MHRRVERQAVRMHEIMERLGVDPVALARLQQGQCYAEARARCLFCKSADTCLRWLESEATSPDVPDFCPNLPLFEASRTACSTTVTHRTHLPCAELGAVQKKSCGEKP